MHSRLWWVPVLLCSIAALAQQEPVRLLDPQSVSIEGDPLSWIVEVRVPQRAREIECDVLVAGGGTGGVAAALTAARTGRKVCLTEETDWLGGQFTSQGVSAFDDHRFIEEAGGTGTYYDLRRRIREAYQTRYRLSELGKSLKHFNPGNCYVSPLCFEPPVERLQVREHHRPHSRRAGPHPAGSQAALSRVCPLAPDGSSPRQRPRSRISGAQAPQ